jgi:hypothetical protein
MTGKLMPSSVSPRKCSLRLFWPPWSIPAPHHARVRRLALVTDSALAPVAEFMANHVVGLEMRHFPFAAGMSALAWLRSS